MGKGSAGAAFRHGVDEAPVPDAYPRSDVGYSVADSNAAYKVAISVILPDPSAVVTACGDCATDDGGPD